MPTMMLLPRHSVVRPGQTVVLVSVSPMGPRRRWPGTYDDPHPLQSMPEVIHAVAGEPYTVQPGEYWPTDWYPDRATQPLQHARYALVIEGSP